MTIDKVLIRVKDDCIFISGYTLSPGGVAIPFIRVLRQDEGPNEEEAQTGLDYHTRLLKRGIKMPPGIEFRYQMLIQCTSRDADILGVIEKIRDDVLAIVARGIIDDLEGKQGV